MSLLLQLKDVEIIISSNEYNKLSLALELYEKSKNLKTKEKWDNLLKNFPSFDIIKKWGS